MKRLLLAVCLTLMMMFVAAPGAQADVYTNITYDITSDHMTGGAGTPPFGTVHLVQSGTSVDFTVTLNSGNLFMRSGFDYSFFFNATSVVTTDFSSLSVFDEIAYGAPTAGPPARPDGTLHANGTGYWMFGVYNPDQGNGSGDGLSGPLTFSIADATIADVIIGNGEGNIFAIDMYSGQTRNTGMVDVSTPPRVPEPTTLLLLGIGLVGFAGLRRKFHK